MKNLAGPRLVDSYFSLACAKTCVSMREGRSKVPSAQTDNAADKAVNLQICLFAFSRGKEFMHA